MKRKLLIGASFGALMFAAMAPWSAAKANGVSVRVSTPEFGIRIGAPHRPAYYPVPVYGPPPVVYAPRPRYVVPPPVIYRPPYYYTGGRGYHRHHHWRHPHWRHHHWRNDRHHRGHDGHRSYRGRDDD
ncbi:MAG: hypothetical protein ACRECQ_04560 [Burkholderiaceae bacterium]